MKILLKKQYIIIEYQREVCNLDGKTKAGMSQWCYVAKCLLRKLRLLENTQGQQHSLSRKLKVGKGDISSVQTVFVCCFMFYSNIIAEVFNKRPGHFTTLPDSIEFCFSRFITL